MILKIKDMMRKKRTVNSQSGNYIFEKLTPTSVDDLGIYEDALNYVFENDDITNIAISGSYGAGKSSVLYTYESKNDNLRFKHISLAHFKELNYDNNTNSPEDTYQKIEESVLEGKILNQLIHQIPVNKIPQTNFRVKKPSSPIATAIYSCISFLMGILIFRTTLSEMWKGFVESMNIIWIKNLLLVSTTPTSTLLFGILLAILSLICIIGIVKMQIDRHIVRKLNVQGNEIEIFGESNDSFFDKYLNEVLYLFQNVDADVIVFEDMDRFDAAPIFERLREINTLANQNRRKNKKGIVRFFYLLKDDIFISKDRTKFFDFIIPIVPVMDSSNSYDQFIAHLKRNNLFNKFDEKFLQGLSLYVDDMRLLKNICNEFLIYFERINTTELNFNKMLAIIVYKNLFPRDFSNLQLNKGFVYSLFEKKSKLIKEEQDRIDKQINELELKIQSINSEHIKSDRELELITKGLEATRDGYYRYSSNYSAADNELQTWKKNDLPKRKDYVGEQASITIKKIKNGITELQNASMKLKSQPFSELITRDNIDSLFAISVTNEIGIVNSFNEIKGNDYFSLLKYLIRNGYIDETYPDYMTYFYENSLQRTDKVFLRSVTDKIAKGFEYELRKPEMVFTRLSITDYDNEETLNYCLVDHLLQFHTESEQLIHLVNQIKKAKNYTFISGIFNLTNHKKELVTVLNKQYPELLSEAIVNKSLPEDIIKSYSVFTLYYSTAETLNNVNVDSSLTNYISGSPEYLNITSPNISRLIEQFGLINVRFYSINYDVSDKELFVEVYEHGYYDLNFDNISLFLRTIPVYSIKNEDDIVHKTTTLVLSNPETALAKNISNNIAPYVRCVLDHCGGVVQDDEKIAIHLMNNMDIGADDKVAYIEALKTPISLLSAISDKSIWKVILSSNNLCYSEDNVLCYFEYIKGLDDALINYINNSEQDFDFSRYNEPYKELKSELFNHLIICSSICDRQYRSMLNSIDRYYDDFNLTSIAESKIKILIDVKIIRMNAKTLLFMRKQYPNVIYYFISANIKEYIAIIGEKTIYLYNECISTMALEEVDEECKMELLKVIREPISIKDRGYSVRIREYILTHNLSNDDLLYLFEKYDDFEDVIQKIVVDVAISNMSYITTDTSSISKSLFDRIMESEYADTTGKLDLLIYFIPCLEKDKVINCLRRIDKGDLSKVFDSSTRPHYDKTEINRRLLQAIKEKGWIVDYRLSKNRYGNEFYSIRRSNKKYGK